ncbi:hypothetical protein OROHE_014250 [Orobanche hederae]
MKFVSIFFLYFFMILDKGHQDVSAYDMYATNGLSYHNG